MTSIKQRNRFYSMGHVAYGGVLRKTVRPDAGELRLCVYACPQVVPRTERLCDYFREAIDEL